MGVAAMLEILVGGGNKVKTKEKGKNPSPMFPLSPEEPQLQICRLHSGKKSLHMQQSKLNISEIRGSRNIPNLEARSDALTDLRQAEEWVTRGLCPD